MAPNDDLEYLKYLVSQLNEKIKALEAKSAPPAKPKEEEVAKGIPKPGGLRMILIGPPGAGESCYWFCWRVSGFLTPYRSNSISTSFF